MHYGIIALGSRGDVQPYVALALGLISRGHRVTLMAHENFKLFVEGYGVEFHGLDGNVETMLLSEEALKVLKSGRLLDFARYLKRNTEKTQIAVGRDMLAGCQQPDFLIASLLAVPWVDCLAESLTKNWAIVQPNLPSIPTSEFPLAPFAYWDFPFYNRMTYRLFRYFYWKTNRKAINNFRKTLGVAPLKKSILEKIDAQKILNIHAVSPSLVRRPNDWSPENEITGFLFIPANKPAADMPDQIYRELDEWISAGEKPVYIGFGSIPIPEPAKFKAILMELLSKTEDRYVFCEGWSPPMNLPPHPRLFVIKSVSHAWLLPRCRAAVIHGGSGTLAACLKSKIPVILVSIIADQPWWGRIIENKKLGLHIPFRNVTGEKLLSAIKKIKNFEIINEVSKTGEKINSEDGLNKTVNLLEKYFSSKLHDL